jgi:hypothetical protein
LEKDDFMTRLGTVFSIHRSGREVDQLTLEKIHDYASPGSQPGIREHPFGLDFKGSASRLFPGGSVEASSEGLETFTLHLSPYAQDDNATYYHAVFG